MTAIALVNHSRTVLTSWSNSCATIASSSRDWGAQNEQAMDGRGLERAIKLS
jgi:hypothetical protein